MACMATSANAAGMARSGAMVRGSIRELRQVQHQRPRRSIAGKRQAPVEQLVEHDAQRVEIAATVECKASSLLGAHVLRGAAHQTGKAHEPGRGGDVAADDLGQPEVDDLDHVEAGPQRLEHDVVGLEVSVDDAECMGLVERGESLAQDVDDSPQGQCGPRVGQASEILTFQVFHDDVGQTVLRHAEIGKWRLNSGDSSGWRFAPR